MQLLQLQISRDADGCTEAELTLTLERRAAFLATKCVKWIAMVWFEFLSCTTGYLHVHQKLAYHTDTSVQGNCTIGIHQNLHSCLQHEFDRHG